MSPNQAIPNESLEGVTLNVPNLPFSQAQRNEIFSETSSRIYRELCGPEGVVLQQNNILQQVIQEVHSDPMIQETLSEQQEKIGQIITEIYRLREELAKLKLTLKQGFVLIDETCAKHATVLDHLQAHNSEQTRKFKKHCSVFRDSCRLFNREQLNLRKTHPLTSECKP